MDKEIKTMDKTPIQQAIDNINYKMKFSTLSYDEKYALRATITMLKTLLATERQFAETCFDAGYELGAEEERYMYCSDIQAPDFTNFFKQYSND